MAHTQEGHLLRFWWHPKGDGPAGSGRAQGTVERLCHRRTAPGHRARSGLRMPIMPVSAFSTPVSGVNTSHSPPLAGSCSLVPGTSLRVRDVNCTVTNGRHWEDSHFTGGDTEAPGGGHMDKLTQLVSGGVRII